MVLSVITPSPLKGCITSQPSKSMAHRAIISAFLAKGKSVIDNIVLSEDIKATIEAVKSLGADVLIDDSANYAGRQCVTVISDRIFLRNNFIDCNESGSTARFIMPITRLISQEVTITGRGRLIERPFSVYKDLFAEKGVKYSDNSGKMPISLEGQLEPGIYNLPGDVSSQFITGLLFTLPLLEGNSVINITTKLESLPYIMMTLQVLNEFGITIKFNSEKMIFVIPGFQRYKSVPYYVVEGDWSQAAFFCVMGAISDHITIKGLNQNSRQGDKAIIDILNNMGAKVTINEDEITVSKSNLKGIEVDSTHIPDLIPIISVAASLSQGTTVIKNAERLRIKESDRLTTTRIVLEELGAKIIEKPDGLIIEGVAVLKGGRVSGYNDHRIVMAVAAASAVSKGVVEISGSEAIKKSYPDFWKDFAAIGGKVKIYE
ncbi:MAG: 3-phosphoshikimate 1-carboxyvinyltransferase [Clostridiaceae bacterium]|nr:3-phosphoshikimate 1-carboxyvinyltransferase [Clostridiaceae bacterium]